MTIKILLVEDHAMLRAGLRSLIEGQADLEIVGQAENGRVALTLAAELEPDVIIMDVTMRGMNGVEATRLIKAAHPAVKIIALSAFDKPNFVLGMIKAGASGYLLKDNLFEELLKAIHVVVSGEAYLCPQVTKIVVEDCLEERTSRPNLNEDEIELVELLAQGRSATAIGTLQGMSVKTVEGRRGRLLKKLHLESIAELVQYALAEGVISEQPTR